MTPKNEMNEDLGRVKELEAERFRRRLLAVEKEAEMLRARLHLVGLGFALSLTNGNGQTRAAPSLQNGNLYRTAALLGK